MVGIIGGVGVHIAAPDKLEPGLGRQCDDVRFLDISGGGARVLFAGVGQPVLDHAQNSARTQRRMEVSKGALGKAAAHPVVDVAEGQDGIDAALRRNGTGIGAEVTGPDLAVERIAGKFLEEGGARIAARFAGAVFREGRGNILSAIGSNPGRDDARIPAAARPDLDDGSAWVDAEEFQGLTRVAPCIAFAVFAAPVTGDRPFQAALCGLGGRNVIGHQIVVG